MTLGELLDQVKGLPRDTLVCIAEVDEAFGVNIAEVEVLDECRVDSEEPDGAEAIELLNGETRAVVIRW